MQTDEQVDSGGLLGELELGLAAAKKLYQFIPDHLDNLLARGQGLHHLLAQSALLHPLNELLGDLEVYIGIQERVPDLPGRCINMALGDTPLAAQISEDFLQLVRKIF